jgi:orotate phosphoribosyltransferase
MLSSEESLKILKETRALIEGHFILSSGLHSSKYVQCAQLMSKPFKATKLCASLSEKIKIEIPDFDLILSPAMGGILIGYEIGKLLQKETIFSERVNGRFHLRRDFKIKKGSKVLIIEDVITTGKSSLECSELVTANGAFIVGYGCIIDRSNGKSKIRSKIISQVELNIPTFTKNNLPKELSSIEPVKPGSRNLS